jgi:hypothetical protein
MAVVSKTKQATKPQAKPDVPKQAGNTNLLQRFNQKLMETETRHPLGGNGKKMLHPDELLRKLGVTQPVHPNQANRIFWRYCKDRHLIR